MKAIISNNKFNHLMKCSNSQGIITAIAIDHYETLKSLIRQGRDNKPCVRQKDLSNIKKAIAEKLTPYATSILLDPVIGLSAIQVCAPHTGIILSYETPRWDPSRKGRLPRLLSKWSVRRLVESGANGVKIVVDYDPDDDLRINTIKQALIERVGAECKANDVPFFFEPVYFDSEFPENQSHYAKRKPEAVIKSAEEFSKENYLIDILKVELPFDIRYLKGADSFIGTSAYTRSDVIGFIHEASEAAKKNFIYLSGGVCINEFIEMMSLVKDAKSSYSGILCGRAIWQDGIAVYGREGLKAFSNWLEKDGVKNVTNIDQILSESAVPWWSMYEDH